MKKNTENTKSNAKLIIKRVGKTFRQIIGTFLWASSVWRTKEASALRTSLKKVAAAHPYMTDCGDLKST
jgi:hypothetical protein